LRPIGGSGRKNWGRFAAAGAAGLSLIQCLGPAFAEFEIPEVDIDKGSIEAEYRGAQHWGLPQAATGEDVEALRQSHELEIQFGITDFWAVRITPNVEQPDGSSLDLNSIGIETQFVLVRRNEGPFGLAFMAGYSPVSLFVDLEQPDELEFGPVIEIAGKTWLASFNPRLARELGKFADQESVGFEYAAQFNYRIAKRWSIAALAFGEIDDLANAGSFEDQSHILGPGLYVYSPNGAGDAEPGDVSENHAMERFAWSLGVGALFGLTDDSDDVTLRVTFAVER
jgi:hypothetical protein